MNKILITGAAGFIGYHLASKLLAENDRIIGLDNLSNYYDVALKEARINNLQKNKNFKFIKADLAERDTISRLFVSEKPDAVINLAAQPGVRYSIENPHAYVDSNLVSFVNILEGCRHNGVKHLVYASSSSVHHNVDHPISLYAATKKANELMAHTYSHLYNLPTTGLRFFTVYGPWGRPDMAIFKFTKAIIEGQAIDVYNHGDMERDFTYVDDIVEGIYRVLKNVPQSKPSDLASDTDPAGAGAPYKIYNIGNNQPVQLKYVIEQLERAIGKQANINLLPMQPGDLKTTFANIDDLIKDVGFKPATPIETGIKNFVQWYKSYYKIS